MTRAICLKHVFRNLFAYARHRSRLNTTDRELGHGEEKRRWGKSKFASPTVIAEFKDQLLIDALAALWRWGEPLVALRFMGSFGA